MKQRPSSQTKKKCTQQRRPDGSGYRVVKADKEVCCRWDTGLEVAWLVVTEVRWLRYGGVMAWKDEFCTTVTRQRRRMAWQKKD